MQVLRNFRGIVFIIAQLGISLKTKCFWKYCAKHKVFCLMEGVTRPWRKRIQQTENYFFDGQCSLPCVDFAMGWASNWRLIVRNRCVARPPNGHEFKFNSLLISQMKPFFKFPRKTLADSVNPRTFASLQCGVEQLVARRAHNPEVAGSSPVPATQREEVSKLIFSPVFFCPKTLLSSLEMRISSFVLGVRTVSVSLE